VKINNRRDSCDTEDKSWELELTFVKKKKERKKKKKKKTSGCLVSFLKNLEWLC